MEQKFNEIIKKAKTIRMKPEEKSDIRTRLYVLAGGGMPVVKTGNFGWRIFRPVPMFASLMIALLVGGSVSFASEGSLPGDILYPIKIAFNEEVRATVALSSEAKADWEVRRAERRLEEAEKLSEKGELDEEKKAFVDSKITEHAEKAGRNSEKAEARALVKAKAKSLVELEMVLQKHSRILSRLAEEQPAQAAIAMKSAADSNFAAVEATQNTEEQDLRAARKKIEEVSKFFSKEARLSEEDRAEIRDEIKTLPSPTKVRPGVKVRIEP